jgi:3-hydroxybutyryl-CoA dehydrogenase
MDESVAAEVRGRVRAVTELDELSTCDLVIESIVEDLAAKRTLFAALSRRLPPEAVLATNTSTLRVAALADQIRPHRTIGLHFFSPVPAMNLVELAYLPGTDPDVAPAAERFVAKLGKTAVPVLDSTGFIVNRLLVPLLLNSIHAYEQGLATADQIDSAMRLGCGHPMGPLALTDLIGLYVVYAMAKLPTTRLATRAIARLRCRAGSSSTASSARRPAAASTITRKSRRFRTRTSGS